MADDSVPANSVPSTSVPATSGPGSSVPATSGPGGSGPRGAGPDASPRLEAGTSAPSFTLDDQDGHPVSLADFSGEKVVVYFYPAASTPGCTTQACDFRDNINSLRSAGYRVLGVSKDDGGALRRFRDEQGLNFPLLSDPDLAVHKAYGAWGEKSMYGKTTVGTLRSTFVVDESGDIRLPLYNVKATGHVASLRKKLGID